jgi:hypothetical protein
MYKAILCSAVCAALAAPLAVNGTRAATSQGQFAIEGAGIATCSAFLTARQVRRNGASQEPAAGAQPAAAPQPTAATDAGAKSQPDADIHAGLDTYARFIGWVEGYLTGVNRYTGDTYDVAPWQMAELYGVIIAGHCEKNPNERLFEVVQKMAITMSATRLKAPSPLVRLDAKGRSFTLYEEVIRQVQQVLRRQNLYEGEANGQWSEDLQRSLGAYQVLVGLPDTGLPDQITLWLLFSPPVQAAAKTTK